MVCVLFTKDSVEGGEWASENLLDDAVDGL